MPHPSDVFKQIELLKPDIPYSLDRSLLHAYVACLSLPDLCRALLANLSNAGGIRAALKARLVKLSNCGGGGDGEVLDQLVREALAMAASERQLRPTVDALCAGIFSALPPPTQQQIMEGWLDRGSKGAIARWLKAARQDPRYFDEGLIWSMWRANNDERLLQSLCIQASPEILAEALTEIAEATGEGWLVSKAYLRASHINPAAWEAIRERHPATYLYVCAKLERQVDEDDAVRLILLLPTGEFPDTRGLAIWALGQLGMYSALTKVHAGLGAT